MPVAANPPNLAITTLEDFRFGLCPKPVVCGRGVEIGTGNVVPEVNFTLSPIDINESTWSEIRSEYQEMIEGVCERAVDLEVPALLVEFETLPPMTVRPEWGAQITQLLADTLEKHFQKHGLISALRLTPNDTRDHIRPPLMRRGEYWDGMLDLFQRAPDCGADLLAIESTGGKEVCDEALMTGDLRTVVFALGVLAARDMEFLWGEIVRTCHGTKTIPSGDTACGFANTAMVLAEQKMIPKVFAAIVRVASVPRDLVAYRMGAKGPSKDCAYEGPYVKAIAGVPISMEGRTSACAHLSHVGNIAQAVCDCWSNESVQNLRLLSANAPTVSMEQLAYDCRLMNVANSHSSEDARRLRNLLVESDARSDPQAYVLDPAVVLKISKKIIQEESPYLQTRTAAHAAIEVLKEATDSEELRLSTREKKWLDRLEKEMESLPESEEELIEEMLSSDIAKKFIPGEYGITA
ncbi:MAG: methanol--corrinoid methyltransferase [Candidatus Omnitrophica bacterium]|nr:methanol--corrinoid methyltransferase [Candidatus Omnitrophota bacterium]